MQQRATNGEQHANFARPNAVTRSCRRAHELQRQDEQHTGDEVNDFDDSLIAGEVGHAGVIMVWLDGWI